MMQRIYKMDLFAAVHTNRFRPEKLTRLGKSSVDRQIAGLAARRHIGRENELDYVSGENLGARLCQNKQSRAHGPARVRGKLRGGRDGQISVQGGNSGRRDA